MGARGPKPTPTAVKLARGTYRPDRAPANEPQAMGKPTCPKWLRPDARREFRRLVKLLSAMGLIGSVDANALTRYCSTWVRWRQAVQMIEKAGEVTVFRDESGKPKAVQPSAFVSIARGLAEQLDKLEASFGMTPSARSRINVTSSAAATSDPADQYFDDAPPLRLAQ